jgi:hypothetical protein
MKKIRRIRVKSPGEIENEKVDKEVKKIIRYSSITAGFVIIVCLIITFGRSGEISLDDFKKIILGGAVVFAFAVFSLFYLSPIIRREK